MKHCTVTILVVALFTGCVHRPSQPEWQLGKYSFGYVIENPGPIGLVQVFDDGITTYLQFADPQLASQCVKVRTSTVKRLALSSVGAYLVLKGVYASIELRRDQTRKECQKLGRGTLRSRSIITTCFRAGNWDGLY